MLKLPYCGDVSVRLKKQLLKLFKTYYPNADLRVVFKSGFTIGKLFPFKDRAPASVRSHAVYKVKCEGCPSFYVGKTINHVFFRVKREITSMSENSPVFQHAMSSGENCHFILDNTTILCSDPIDSRLCIKESILIKQLKPDLNRDKESVPLLLL